MSLAQPMCYPSPGAGGSSYTMANFFISTFDPFLIVGQKKDVMCIYLVERQPGLQTSLITTGAGYRNPDHIYTTQ